MADRLITKEQCSAATDQELVAQTIADKHAFAAIVLRYQAPLLRYIIRLGCKDSCAAEDLLQEIFIKIYIHLNEYDPFLQFSSWIYRIAHNEVITHFRKEKHRPSVLPKDELLILFENLSDDADLIVQDGVKHTPTELQCALDQLEPKYRDVVVLKFFEEKSYEEISDILLIPQGTVATLLNRAKKKIKIALETSCQ